MMEPTECERMSVLLSEYLDRELTESQEEVEIRRRGYLILECLDNSGNADLNRFYGGSRTEGINFATSDLDVMHIDKNVVVTYLEQGIPLDNINKTVLYLREAYNCRPGYVSLQLGHLGQRCTKMLLKSQVAVGDVTFISSDIYREEVVNLISESTGWKSESNGPSSTLATEGVSIDNVFCFPCNSWPTEANEWITRPRLYGWPSQTLINNIKHSECHLVPVGDKCSESTGLQWRISFIMAERRLVHSLSHTQFKVYCLLKLSLLSIKEILGKLNVDDDLCCSYFLKTAIFFAVENSHKTFWQKKNLIFCFMFCFSKLIAWVKAGYCPNYFIPANNMFKRKVHGENQQILLNILEQVYHLKWNVILFDVHCNAKLQAKLIHPEPAQEIEYKRDLVVLKVLHNTYTTSFSAGAMFGALSLLLKPQSEVDEVITYYHTACILSNLPMEADPRDMVSTDNKTRYRSLRKCKHWLIPRASLGTELLYLATFHFQIGNYRKSLEMCKHIVSQASYYTSTSPKLEPGQKAKYIHAFCGQGYTLLHKLKKTITGTLVFEKGNCIPQLDLELSKSPMPLSIPPIPYAVFLSFLCCHELADSRRGTALRNMIVVKYDQLQGGHENWIVHTLLGICYQTLGDNRRAIRAYWDSSRGFHEVNPAKERIAVCNLVDVVESIEAL